MNHPPKDHHYVPRYYLKGFTNPSEPEALYVYRPDKTPFKTGIAGVAFGKHFYTYKDLDGSNKSIETYLANEIEGPANLVLDKIRQVKTITEKDKHILAIYMSVMITRVPRHRERLSSLIPEVVERFRATELDNSVETLLAHSSEPIPDLDAQLLAAHKQLDAYKEKPPSRLQVGQVSTKYATLLDDMNWAFFTSTRKRGFITSDNPVFFFESFGLLGPGGKPSEMVEVSFPISSKVALWATWRTNMGWQDLSYVPAPEPIVAEINRRTAFGTTLHLYYPTKVRWVEALAKTHKPSLKLNQIIKA